ncbi:MAG: hypothetical protein HFI33_01250 [Lachnospiraceae bacterium]|nr:hypothetical protein [Lachnospiraceae bacterium]
MLGSVAASAGGGGTGAMDNILSVATDVLAWFITSMGTLIKFITDNPVVLVLFMIFLVGSAVGMLMRLWKSV